MINTEFDEIIIGSGPVAYAYTNAIKAAKTSRKVLVVENGAFGGTCPNFGCEPKIFLEGVVRNVLIGQQLTNRGIQQPAKIDWQKLMQTKLETFASYLDQAAKAMTAENIATIQGTAKFIDDQTIQIAGQQYQANKIVIATGMQPRRLPIPGKEYTHTSTDVLSLATLPEKVTLIGSGYVSIELATVLNAAGAEVEIIEFADHALGAFYQPHAQVVIQQMQNRGIRFHFNEAVNGVKAFDDGYLVTTSQGHTYETDYVIDASGRVPNVAGLGLENTDIQTDKQAIVVDDHLQTTVPGVYAAGDVIKKDPLIAPKLTPVAQFEGAYLAEATGKAIEYPIVGTGAFSFPQIAQAGVSVTEAAQDARYSIKRFDLASDFAYAGTNDFRAELIGVFEGQQLVGVSEVSQTAADDVNLFVSVIGLQLPMSVWKTQLIFIFPTLATKLKEFLA